MSWIGRAISSVGQYYKEINPATLSGAIDVIVVSHKRPTSEAKENSSDEDIEDLACSPWHVRFGKLSVLRPVERKVRILINGQPAPFSMKIGETGEAFFVFETDVDNLPDELQTSPLVSPVLKSTDTPSTDSQASTAHQEFSLVPDFDDLGERQLQSNKQKWDLQKDTSLQHSHSSSFDQSSSDPIQSLSHLALHSDQKAFQTQTSQNKLLAEEKSWFEVIQVSSKNLELEGSNPSNGQMGQNSNQPVETLSSSPISNSSQVKVPTGQHLTLSSSAGDLMLDIEGYKMAEDRVNHSKQSQNNQIIQPSHPSTPIASTIASRWPSGQNHESSEDLPEELPEEQVMEFTKALLRCSEQINRCFFGTGARCETEKDSMKNHDKEGHGNLMEEAVHNGGQCLDLIIVENCQAENGLGPFDRFKIEVNGISHAFEISILEISDENFEENLLSQPQSSRSAPVQQSYNHQKFRENLLKFEDFFRRDPHPCVQKKISMDSLDDETNFIVKYNQKYILTWNNASTALTSLGIYRKSILALTEHQVIKVVQGSFNHSKALPEQNSQSHFETSNSITQPLSDNATLNHNTQTHDPQLTTSLSSSSLPQPPSSFSRPWTRWWYKSDSQVSTESQHQRNSSNDTWTQDTTSSPEPIGGSTGITVNPDSPPTTLTQSVQENIHHHLSSQESSCSLGDTSVPSTPTPSNKDFNHTSQKLPESTPSPKENRKTYAKTLRLTSEQLKQLGLKKGINHVSFSVQSSYSGYAVCNSRIFLWDSDYKICISDIDGTITKSDALGHVFNMIGRDWTHAGVAKLYTDIARNGYKIMYLTSRAIGQANTTREYLKGINQMGFTLPEGPVIMSPDRLMTSLHREVIMRKPEVFKMACLRDIQRLFGLDRKPFYAGFGNRITDALSYRSVDVPSSRIFTIDSNGEVKMELLELTGYKSSYIHMTDLVDQMFPPIKHSSAIPEFSDFNYWRATTMAYDAMSLKDLDLDELLRQNNNANQAPVSPSLSARSGESLPTSRLSFKLSSLSLVRKTSRVELNVPINLKYSITPTTASYPDKQSPTSDIKVESGSAKSKRLSQLSCGELIDSNLEDFNNLQVPHRLRSDSMPGSLPGSVEEASLLESLRNDFSRQNSAINLFNQNNSKSIDKKDEINADDEDDEFPQTDFSSVPYL
ncbi:hypothetical protein O181_022123 [Austropuccinia psidii MF-1]|uniref:LNS2/PITP domain-containing protein n=1 Tax=Austropuccinia psidii MF-1 TaxID=1389203 RepID=A0A9Q3GW19_9BASI|nr:hypothetical protein [Austropuccinia psidii MF-1]